MTDAPHAEDRPARPARTRWAVDSADEKSEQPTPRPRRAGGSSRSAADAARLARIFGETLPQTSSDERSPDGERPGSSDDWLRSQVPPHHQ
ncbi:hypothetical protein NDR87_25050 [Nocardia sp. CDC159]|uniref:Uncharacterized protein n=1 Tax=Nocardia pulmonis TaxID=2951408 RepID=A0A9X2E6T2_9NOCA|nr:MULTISPECIES: hypothetical protein [Nocardia]MCM6775172.1 hypothetical protein [Nocardia pulmonis]MCM6789642.1 hypothetical protein [Nocardia sp. CDC159]